MVSYLDGERQLSRLLRELVEPFAGDSHVPRSGLVLALSLGFVTVVILSMAGWGERFWPSGGQFSPFGSSAYPAQVLDEDYSYITADDLAPPPRTYDLHAAPRPPPLASDDIILLRSRGHSIPLHFRPYSIDDGHLVIADLRDMAAKILDVHDPTRLRLFYKGRPLREALRPCREEGLKINSEVLCELADEPADVSYGQVPHQTIEGGESSDTERDDSGTLPGDGTLRKKRTRHRKKKGKKPEAELAPPPPPNSTQAKLEALSSHFSTTLLPQCVQFTNHPPSDPAKREFEHGRLAETILSEVLLKLDAVDTEGEQEMRQRRKDLVKQTQEVLNGLDAVMRGGNA